MIGVRAAVFARHNNETLSPSGIAFASMQQAYALYSFKTPLILKFEHL
jgi:hypothetical protein